MCSVTILWPELQRRTYMFELFGSTLIHESLWTCEIESEVLVWDGGEPSYDSSSPARGLIGPSEFRSSKACHGFAPPPGQASSSGFGRQHLVLFSQPQQGVATWTVMQKGEAVALCRAFQSGL